MEEFGVVYYTFNRGHHKRPVKDIPPELLRSVESVREHAPNLPICWITECEDEKHYKHFDQVILSKSSLHRGFHKRTTEIRKTPYKYTLHLDSDTVILGDLSFGFEMAQKHHLAIVHDPLYNADRYGASQRCPLPDFPRKDLVVYNCGVFFYDQSDHMNQVFDTWEKYNLQQPAGFLCDQLGLAFALYDNDLNPYVLPKSWNWRAACYTPSMWSTETGLGYERQSKHISGHGPIRIWHSHAPVDLSFVSPYNSWSR